MRRDPLEQGVRLVLGRALAAMDAFEERAVELLIRALPLPAELDELVELARLVKFEFYGLGEFIITVSHSCSGASFVWR